MAKDTELKAIRGADAPARTRPSNYPEPFAALVAGRVKRPLGDVFGLKNFGVNLVRLPPGSISALHHMHSKQDEFIYVLEGHPTLFMGEESSQLAPGMVAGFPAGGAAHHLENQTGEDCMILEVGDRSAGDSVSYPRDDIRAVAGVDGKWSFTHKNGKPYE
jgi:uncharacterized cupin superfamily protein